MNDQRKVSVNIKEPFSNHQRTMFIHLSIDIPIGSMYGIYANIWGILMVNVSIYGIHVSIDI